MDFLMGFIGLIIGVVLVSISAWVTFQMLRVLFYLTLGFLLRPFRSKKQLEKEQTYEKKVNYRYVYEKRQGKEV